MKWLTATIAGAHGADRLRQIAGGAPFSTRQPVKVSINFDDVTVDERWPEAMIAANGTSTAWWDASWWANTTLQLGYSPKSGELVAPAIPVDQVTLESGLSLIEPLPFEICAFGSAFFDEWIEAGYERTSFSQSHIQHGWACVFRGKGHERLVSRRWLDFGPWRVIRRPNDTTFIQFHDLAITDPAEAYAQAWPGHERMGISDTGGFIQHIMEPLVEDVRYLYVPGKRRAEIVVGHGNEVPQWDMTCARALRLYTQLNPGVPNPIDELAFMFVDEADARAHLHELWLRELECWVVDDKGKRRIDLDYHPVPNPPEWVKRLDRR